MREALRHDMILPLVRITLSVIAVSYIAGCTYVQDKSDLMSGRTDARVEAAKVEADRVNQDHAQLEVQKRATDIQLAAISDKLQQDQARLASIDKKLHEAYRATDDQKAQYRDLSHQYAEIKKQMDEAAAAPSDLRAQQQKVAELQAKKEELERRIDMLNGSIR